MTDAVKYNKSNEEEKVEENVVVLLTKLYRLAYESIENEQISKDLENKYNDIIKDCQDLSLNVHAIPKSAHELVEILEETIKKPTEKLLTCDEAKIELVKYCQNSNIDAAILLILKYKLKNDSQSATEICNYVHKWSGGWNSYSGSAIHVLLNKKQCDIKTLLLFEILFREKTSTKLMSTASGYNVKGKRSNTILDRALEKDNIDILRLLFQYGFDIDVNLQCNSNRYGNSSSGKKSWKPIHTAIARNNYELTELIIKRGANINEYKKDRLIFNGGGGSDKQLTALYLICSKSQNDNNKMLKLILNSHQQKFNGIPDVNAISVIMEAESEYSLGLKERPKYDPDRRRHGSVLNNYDYEPHINLYTHISCIHVAVKKCDIEMIKLLLIYGADINIYQIKLERRLKLDDLKDIQCIKRDSLKEYEYVKNVFDILKESGGDEKIKNLIEKILKSGSKWFPEMIDFYPNNMGLSIKNILETLQMNSVHFPVGIVNIIIDYFYDIVENDVVIHQKTQ